MGRPHWSRLAGDMNTGFIGIGSMGGMLVRALLRSGALSSTDVFVANRSKDKLDALAAHFPGIHVVSSSQIAGHCDLIFICVSAGDMPAVLAQIAPELSSKQLLATTSAVVPLKALEERVLCRAAKLIPSLTQEIGAGIALLMYGSRVTAEDRNLLEELLGHISQPISITEPLARPAIGLASGGPALIAYVLQSMADEAVRSNAELSPELAHKLVQETMSATMRLVQERKMSLDEIIRRVAVPGGMTALSIEILSRCVPQAWETVFRETAARERKSREALVL
jgi:competence protein ComER